MPAPSVSSRADARDVRLLAEHLVGAELASEPAPPLVGVDRDHPGGAQHADELQPDVPDPADADHGRCAPRLEPRDELLHGVVSRDARVGVRRDRRRLDALRQRDDRPLVGEDVVREAAVAREPGELVAHAEDVLAAPAGDAEAAAPRGVEEHRVADRRRRDVRRRRRAPSLRSRARGRRGP